MTVPEFFRSQTVRLLLAWLLPLPVIFLQWLLSDAVQPSVWFLIYPVLFFAPLIGGRWGGIGATLISVLLVWYIFLSPQFSMAVTETRAPFSSAIVLASGIVFSLVLDRVRRRDEQFRTLFNMAGDGIAYVDAMGRFLAVNDRYCQMLGRARREIVGARVTDLPVGITPEFFDTVSAQLAQGGRVTFERQIRRSDGALLPVEVTAAPLSNHQRVSIVRDISERKRAEAALVESERKYRDLYDNSPDMYLADYMSDHIISDCNQTLARTLGYSKEELIGQPDQILFAPASLARMEEVLPQYAAAGGYQNFEVQLRRKDGSVVEALMSGVIEPSADSGPRFGPVTLRDVTERTQLERYRSFLAAIVDSAADAIAALDLDLIVTAWNRGAERLTGYMATEILGRPVTALPGGTDVAMLKELVAVLRRGESVAPFEYIRQARDGAVKTVTVTPSAIHDGSGHMTGISFIIQDVTEWKRLEQELRTSENKWQSIFKFFPVGVSIVDSQHRVTACNPALCRILQLSEEEILTGTYARRRYLRADGTLMSVDELPTMRALREGRDVIDVTIGVELEDGALIWTSVSATPTSIHGYATTVTVDITERMQAEAATRTALHRLRLAQDAAQIGVWTWNFAEDNVEWDDRSYGLFGISPTEQYPVEVVRRTRIHPDDLAACDASLAAARLAGADWHSTFRIVLPNGQTRYIYSASMIESDHTGAPRGMIGIHRDVSDEQMYRRFLEDANAQLELAVAERTAQLQATADELVRANAGKDAFLAAISHELRTPLTGILGMAEALETQFMGALTAQQLRYVSHIQASGRRLLDLVNGILFYAGLMAGAVPVRTEACRLVDLCAASVRAVKEKAAIKGQEILIDVEPADLAITSDPELITRILTLLLDNAVKFTGESGMIGLLAERAAHVDVVYLAVWDTGIGIPEDRIPCLFDPFTQVDQTLARRYEGVGVGLPAARKLVDLLGGSIAVESEVGRGSRFIVTLPCTLAPAAD